MLIDFSLSNLPQKWEQPVVSPGIVKVIGLAIVGRCAPTVLHLRPHLSGVQIRVNFSDFAGKSVEQTGHSSQLINQRGGSIQEGIGHTKRANRQPANVIREEK